MEHESSQPRTAGGRAHLVGRLRGPRLGPAAAARARVRRDGRARPDRDRARAPWAGCRRTAPRPARCSTATACGSSAGSCRSSCTRPTWPTREHARRAAAQLAAGRRRGVRRRRRAGPAWSPPVAARRATAGSAPASTCARSRTASPREGVSSCCTRTSARSLETAADVERALAHTDVPWCFDTGHLLIGGVDPVAVRPRPRRPHRPRPLKDVDATLAERVRAGELVARAGRAGRPVPAAGGRGRADRRGRPRSSTHGVRALARARAGPRHHRVGAPGRRRSGARCRTSIEFLSTPGSEERGVSTA